MKAMVLAAGFGKRLSPLTDTLPKPLIKVGDQSLIQRNINYLIDNGFSEIIINVSHHSDQVINHVKEIFPNINILFSIEDKPLGTGGGILNDLPMIGNKPFLFIIPVTNLHPSSICSTPSYNPADCITPNI